MEVLLLSASAIGTERSGVFQKASEHFYGLLPRETRQGLVTGFIRPFSINKHLPVHILVYSSTPSFNRQLLGEFYMQHNIQELWGPCSQLNSLHFIEHFPVSFCVPSNTVTHQR